MPRAEPTVIKLADAIGIAEQVIAALQQQIDAFRELSISLAYEDA